MEWCAPQPYRKSVAHRILNRLVMRDSVPGTDLADPLLVLPEGLFEAEEIARYRATLKRMAVPYKVTGRTRADRVDLPLVPMNASNGLVSTVRDLARFDAAFDTLDRSTIRPAAAGDAGRRLDARAGARRHPPARWASAGSSSSTGASASSGTSARCRTPTRR